MENPNIDVNMEVFLIFCFWEIRYSLKRWRFGLLRSQESLFVIDQMIAIFMLASHGFAADVGYLTD